MAGCLRPLGASCAGRQYSKNITAVRASTATRGILVVQPPRDLSMACGPGFFAPLPSNSIRVNLHYRAVQRSPLRLAPHALLYIGGVRTPGPGFRSSTSHSSGGQWWARARTEAVSPAICSHARRRTGLH